MLKKLIKHEFKATYRFYVPVYIALAALVALACIFLTVIDHFDVNELFLSITLPLGDRRFSCHRFYGSFPIHFHMSAILPFHGDA